MSRLASGAASLLLLCIANSAASVGTEPAPPTACPAFGEPSLYPASPQAASRTRLTVVDCTAASNTTKLAATTLQGVVNAGAAGAQVYLLLAAWDPFWLSTVQRRGLAPDHARVLTPPQFFAAYANAFDTVIA
eukprot:gene44348-1591_t